MEKKIYQGPRMRVLDVWTEGAFLINSAEGMNPIPGSWEEDDE